MYIAYTTAASVLSEIVSMDLPLHFGNLIPDLVMYSTGSLRAIELIFADISSLNSSTLLKLFLNEFGQNNC